MHRNKASKLANKLLAAKAWRPPHWNYVRYAYEHDRPETAERIHSLFGARVGWLDDILAVFVEAFGVKACIGFVHAHGDKKPCLPSRATTSGCRIRHIEAMGRYPLCRDSSPTGTGQPLHAIHPEIRTFKIGCDRP